MCVLIFFTGFSLAYFSFREILSKIYTGLHIRHPLFLSDLHKTYTFLTDFSKIIEASNFMKICHENPT